MTDATSSGPLAQLQAGYVAWLEKDSTVRSVLGDPPRIFEDVRANPTFPYLTLGEDQAIRELAECFTQYSVFVTLHIWARAGGFGPVKAAAWAVYDSLRDPVFNLPDWDVDLWNQHDIQSMKDPDGLTTHSVLTFRAMLVSRFSCEQ